MVGRQWLALGLKHGHCPLINGHCPLINGHGGLVNGQGRGYTAVVQRLVVVTPETFTHPILCLVGVSQGHGDLEVVGGQTHLTRVRAGQHRRCMHTCAA